MKVESNLKANVLNSSSFGQETVIPQMPSRKNSEYMSSEASMAARAYAMPQMSFGRSYNKLIRRITTSRPKHIKLTRADLINLLQNEGFIVSPGKGSHITAQKQGEPLFVASSHGSDIDPQTICWLQKYFTRKGSTDAVV